MCRALRVLCVADGRQYLPELKLATVSTSWELVGGASSMSELADQLETWRPDVVVVEASMGAEVVRLVRARLESARIVAVGGTAPGADEVAPSLEDVRAAVLGLPRPGGPVRTKG